MIKFENISKSFQKPILQNISFKIKQGECVAFTGESGTGKSTILNIIGLLENADSGSYYFNDIDVSKLNYKDITKIYKREIGFIFQNFALIDDETVYNNLRLSISNKQDRKNCKQKIEEVLRKVKLEGFENKKIYTLSGGEQQRVAIARVLLKKCRLILADEPTGSLDLNTRDEILELLMNIRKEKITIIIVTHDDYVAKWCDRSYRLVK